jgi:membrane protein
MTTCRETGWLERLRGGRAVQALVQAVVAWSQGRAFEQGAALAYYAVFAIAPILLLAIAVASLVFGREAAAGRIAAQLESTLGPTVATAIEDALHYGYTSGSGWRATVASGVALFFAATGFFIQLQSALNDIWHVRPKAGRGVWGVVVDRLWSFVAVVGVGILLLGAMVLTTGLTALSRWWPAEWAGSLLFWRVVSFVVSFVFATLAVAFVYRLLPDADIDWRDVWVGAAVSSALFLFGNGLIAWYLQVSGVTSAYGAAGSLVVILLWVYYSSQVLLFGAELTQAYARHGGKPLRPSRNAERV